MPTVTDTVFSVVYALESLLIIVGNAFTIFVFWTRRHTLKRTGYLLINLAVADLLVGVSTVIEIIKQSKHYDTLFSAFQYVCSCASVFCLVTISLERVYAIIWPLRHRTASSYAYILSIALVWIAGLSVGLVFILAILQIVPRVCDPIVTNFSLVSALFIFVAAYVTLRNRMKHTAPELEAHERNTMEQNLKLSRTLFLMIALSLLLWLPSIVLYVIPFICKYCIPDAVLFTSRASHLANSIINPVVYSYRMPVFKEAMQRCLNKCNLFKNRRNEGTTPSGGFDTAL